MRDNFTYTSFVNIGLYNRPISRKFNPKQQNPPDFNNGNSFHTIGCTLDD